MMKSDQNAFVPPLTKLLKPILYLSLNTLSILLILAGRSEGGGVGLIFDGLSNPSSAFDAFVLSITFAFLGALGALLIPHKPNLATFYTLYSVASMASALLLLIWGLYYSFVHGRYSTTV